MMADANRVQTIEPRLLYVNIPFRDQDGLPVFDTITPDINLVQLYRKNRFLGIDRIGDTEQVSVGVTSRVLDVDSGRELMTATIGQTRYFGDRDVALPGMTASTFETSDYIAELASVFCRNVNFDIGHQWGTGDQGTTKSEARLQYRPATNKILNLAYRFRRDSLEQGDLSWSWPVASQLEFRRALQLLVPRPGGTGAVLRPRIRELLLGSAAGVPPPYFDARRNSRFLVWSAIGTEGNDQRRHSS